jgi:putative ABC transport system ATP-binding protein
LVVQAPRRGGKIVIELEGVTKSFKMAEGDMQILHGINLTVGDGEMVAIMGPSGSGKSTLMNIVGCLDTASSGRYMLDGIDVSKLSKSELARARGRKIGFVLHWTPSRRPRSCSCSASSTRPAAPSW